MTERIAGISAIPVGKIHVGERLRLTDPAAVAAIAGEISANGFTSPILVRKQGKGFTLIDGAHRLQAAKEAGLAKIPVQVFRCSDAEALLLEASQQLARAEMPPVDVAVMLAAYRRAYVKANPDTAQGMAGARGRWEQTNSSSFASIIARARGTSVRQVEKIAAAGDALAPNEVRRLQTAKRSATLKDLIILGKTKDPGKRKRALTAFCGGAAASMQEALAEVEGAGELSDKDEVEMAFKEALRDLRRAWKAASAAVRVAFAEEFWLELDEVRGDPGPDLRVIEGGVE